MRRILVTGALGQIGAELVPALRALPDVECVVASDLRMRPVHVLDTALYEHLDCTEPRQFDEVLRRHDIDTIFHLAALLSAVAEDKPQSAWQINMGGLYNVLEAARRFRCRLFFPSSIGAFGPSTPKDHTPQLSIQRPNTMYGVSKVAGELLCDYYVTRFGLDVRGLRLPGLISHSAPPGGGTTDYAVEIFHQALRYRHYTCFLRADTRLDMMYMPDAIEAILQLMRADITRLRYHNAYNVSAMSITPAELAAAIAAQLPGFAIDFEVDPLRQAIADSWPHALDTSAAREDWGFAPRYGLAAMTADMLAELSARIAARAQRPDAS